MALALDPSRTSPILFSSFFATLAMTTLGAPAFLLVPGILAFAAALVTAALAARRQGEGRVGVVVASSYLGALALAFLLATPIVVSRQGYFFNGEPWPGFSLTFNALVGLAPVAAVLIALVFLWRRMPSGMQVLAVLGLVALAYAIALTGGAPPGPVDPSDMGDALDAAESRALQGRVAFAGGAVLVALALLRAARGMRQAEPAAAPA